MGLSPSWTRAVGLLAVGLLAAAARASDGPWFQGFEGPQPSWQVVGGDAAHRLDFQGRARGDAHTGQGCERLQITAEGGAAVYAVHDVGRPSVIDELLPTVWIKADRAGLQLLAHVVLPRSRDPASGAPLSVLLEGTSYATVGRWQQLRLENAPRLLARQTEVLRARYGRGVDPREAYVERIVLNLYGGPGATTVAIDDLDVAGYVPGGAGVQRPVPLPLSNLRPQSAPAAADSAGPPDGARPAGRIRRDGNVLLIDGIPFFPRLIEHQGEPFGLLKQLGFNGVWLAQLPTDQMLADARRLGLWLVCPPPRPGAGPPGLAPPPAIGPGYDCVLAWDLGSGLGPDDLEATRRWAEATKAADLRESGRPLVCRPAGELKGYASCVDLLLVGREPLGSSLELSAFGQWLRQRPNFTRGTPTWTTIQTQPSETLRRQWAVLAAGRPDALPAAFAAEQVRLVTYTAFTAGSRGLVFQSRSPLDATDPDTRRRALTLELLNIELALADPWTAAGNVIAMAETIDRLDRGVDLRRVEPRPAAGSLPAQRPPAAKRPGDDGAEVVAAVIHRQRARLVVPIWSERGAQLVPGQSAGNAVTLVVPGVPEGATAYLLMPGAFRPLRARQGTGGLHLTLDELGLTAMVVLTSEPLYQSELARKVVGPARRAAEIQRQLAELQFQTVQRVRGELAGRAPGSPQAAAWLAAADKSRQQCDRLLATQDWAGANIEAQRASRALRLVERADWETAVRGLCCPVASPAAVTYATLPWHWALVRRVTGSQASANRLPGGELEDFAAMAQAGWQHFQHPAAEVRASAELAPEAAHSGRAGLRLAALPTRPDAPPAVVDSPPLWITSPPVAVEAGELLCIRGYVRIPAAIKASSEGLLIVDSLGGEPLAARIEKTKDWEPFLLYRVAPQSGPMSVTFALTGLGEVHLDDVAVQSLRPAGGR